MLIGIISYDVEGNLNAQVLEALSLAVGTMRMAMLLIIVAKARKDLTLSFLGIATKMPICTSMLVVALVEHVLDIRIVLVGNVIRIKANEASSATLLVVDINPP